MGVTHSSEPEATENSRLTQPLLALVIALAFFLLFPPVGFESRYSLLELSLVILAAVLLISAHRRAVIRVVVVPTALVVLLGLMCASAAWSFASWETARDALTFVVLALAAVFVVQIARLNTILIGIVAGGLVALGGSLALIVLAPEQAFYHTGAVQGFYGTRNGFGYVILAALPAAMAVRLAFRGGFLVKAAIVLALAGGVVASDSKTSIFAMLLVGLVWVALALLRRSWIYLAVLAVGAAIVGVAAVANFGRVLDFLGKDQTLNGRSEIWSAVLSVVPQSPVLGFGWSRSWPAGSPHSAAVVDALGGVTVFHAHNEVLNWLVTLGAVGLIVVVALYTFVLWGGIRMYSRPTVDGGTWILLVGVMLVGRGLTDISETSPQGWLMLMLAACAAAKYWSARSANPTSRLVLLSWHQRQRAPRLNKEQEMVNSE
ncbi:O-antigen ligase [Cryobacterium sp. Hh38]|uniref:O-antigen ligase family protein n=1 Tax=Cryobacterium sp. Hh38 TaxID=1259156 RepID=UPI00141AFEA4|nr:O-antigen ligase family protein [Cryobacterium sp. Hh38]